MREEERERKAGRVREKLGERGVVSCRVERLRRGSINVVELIFNGVGAKNDKSKQRVDSRTKTAPMLFSRERSSTSSERYEHTSN